LYGGIKMIFVFKERGERKYVIQCLKRSQNGRSVFWRDERAGYTEDIKQAGIYSLQELEMCKGNFGDWVIHPIEDISDKDLPIEEREYILAKLKSLADRMSQNGYFMRN